ncbi:MAG TPA: methionyl-tRNA formyltransferase [Thermomicrobiales bacterium]|jgi:methionyl-tRNA formyltransferase|nr:methionyl-tRNA formyltransferase [Thermomicrobiales bacterium]
MSTTTVPDDRPTRPIRVVYFGTPEFAVPALSDIAADSRFEVVLVVTQPDRPSGRGRKLVAPPVKVAAGQLGYPVYQPESLRQPAARQPLIDADADVFVVAAFGMIFGPKTLAIPRHGCINLHASILPRYRGAAPISAAIACRDDEAGVSMMLMEVGLDTGPVLSVVTTPIRSDDTTVTLTARLAGLGAAATGDTVAAWVDGKTTATPQGHGATLTRPLVKADGWLDWLRPAENLEALVRAMWPWPRAWTTTSDGTVLQVHAAALDDRSDVAPEAPGTVRSTGTDVAVATGHGWLRLVTAQAPGGRPVAPSVLLAQGRLSDGKVLGLGHEPKRAPLVRTG